MKHPTALRPGLLRRLLRRPSARLSLFVLAGVFLGAIFLPFVLNYQSQTTSSDAFLAPNTNHLFGTDLNGRDVLARTLQGARISLLVGCAGALVSLGIGTSVGLLAGYVGGRVDALLMRLVDVLYAVPRLILIILLEFLLDIQIPMKFRAIYEEREVYLIFQQVFEFFVNGKQLQDKIICLELEIHPS